MKKNTDINRKEKGGAITKVEKKSLRYSDLKAAEIAKKNNEDKVPVQLDHKTTILVAKNKRDLFEQKHRMEQANKPENQDKVEYLKRHNWRLNKTGLWMCQNRLIQREMEAALQMSGYYDRYSKRS